MKTKKNWHVNSRMNTLILRVQPPCLIYFVANLAIHQHMGIFCHYFITCCCYHVSTRTDQFEIPSMRWANFHVLRTDTGPNTQHWLIFDRVVQQIILQHNERPTSDIDPDGYKPLTPTTDSRSSRDPDHAVIDIDVKKIVQLLVKEEELVAARTKAEEMEKENLEMQSKLAKKEQELDCRMQEKEDLETSLTRMRERLEKESANHSQAVQRALNAEMKVEDLQHKFAQEQHERMRLERLVSEGSIPDDQKISGLSGTNNCAVIPVSSVATLQIATSAPPPPPPPLIMPPPPPPAPMAPAMMATGKGYSILSKISLQ